VAHKAIVLTGGEYAMEAGVCRSLADVVRDAKDAGKDMVVVDSISEPVPIHSRNQAGLAIAAIGMFAGVAGIAGMSPRKEKILRKCALPECEVMHSHNGGYCSADHCREHQRRGA